MIKVRNFLVAFCLVVFIKCHVYALPAIETVQDENNFPTIDAGNFNAEDIKKIEEILNKPGNVDDKVKVLQEMGAGTVQLIMNVTQKALGEIDVLLEDSENAMRELRSQTKKVEVLVFNVTRKFFKQFNDAQLNLTSARRDLLALAHETIHICNSIEKGYDTWQDEHKVILIKERFKQLRRLLEKTKTRLDSAKKKYIALIKTWNDIDADIEIFNAKLSAVAERSTSEFKKREKTLRAAAYSAGTAVTIGMIIADIFGCFGFCSGLVTTTTWAVTAATVETELAKYRAELEKMTTQVESAKNRLKKLENKSDLAIALLENEMALVVIWEAAAENVENQITDFTPEQIQKVLAFQNIFKNSITRLKSAAQNFINFATGNLTK